MSTPTTAELANQLAQAEIQTIIHSLSVLAGTMNEKVNGFAPIIHIALLEPNPPLTQITTNSAIAILNNIFTKPELKPNILRVLAESIEVFQEQPAYVNNFLFITNSLENEIALWELAFTDTSEIENAQQTILNYIESNTDYPFSGGVEPIEESDVGLPTTRPPVLVRMPDKAPSSPDGLRTDKTLKRMPARRTLRKVDNAPKSVEILTDGRQKVYGLISIFVSASALYLLQKRMSQK